MLGDIPGTRVPLEKTASGGKNVTDGAGRDHAGVWPVVREGSHVCNVRAAGGLIFFAIALYMFFNLNLIDTIADMAFQTLQFERSR